MPQNTGTVGAASVLASEGIKLAFDPTPDIPGAALLLVYSPEQRAELVEFAKSHLGGPCKRGSPAWWAIAVLTYEETLRRVEASPARIVPFELDVCAKSGDPGCLGWHDGYHKGPCEYATAVYHQCSECKADDVYGEITHEETCSANQPKDGGFAWRLAESAPKTGEHILVTGLGERGFGVCGGVEQDWCAVVHYWPHTGEEGFYLSSGASDPFNDRPKEFTHWLPLPTPDHDP